MMAFMISIACLILCGIIAAFLFIVRIINDIKPYSRPKIQRKNGVWTANPL